MKKLFMLFAVIGLLGGCGGDESDPVDPVDPNPGTEQPENPGPDDSDNPGNPDDPDPDDSDNRYNPELGDPVPLVGQWMLVKTEYYAADGKLSDFSYPSTYSLQYYIFNEVGIFRYYSNCSGTVRTWDGFYTYDTDTQRLEMDGCDHDPISVTASYSYSDYLPEVLIDGLMRLTYDIDESGNRVVEYYFCSSSSASELPEKEDLIFIEIPDANFKYQISSFDTNRDGRISVSEAARIDRLVINSKRISSLEGIEYCTALTYLDCRDNQLTALDLSKNTALETLVCFFNQLISLDVSQNTALKYLQCPFNQLTALDVSQNTQLQTLYCHSNSLIALDVSRNTALQLLECSNNQLTALDVSQNTALTELRCSGNQLTILDVSNCKNLQSLSLSPMPSLKTLYMATEQEIPNKIIPDTTQILYKYK